MAKLTREQVVQRAVAAFQDAGYIWGGYYGAGAHCHLGSNGIGVGGSGPYIATDCSGYTSWCWGVGYHAHSSSWGPGGVFGGSNFRYRVSYTGDIETDFPGIQPGDVIARPGTPTVSGHVVIYIGGGETLEASTKQWTNTPTGRGMVHRTSAVANWVGFCTYDGTFGADYDPSTAPVVDWNPSQPEYLPNPPTPESVDDDQLFMMSLLLNYRYTRRYEVMRHWRKLK